MTKSGWKRVLIPIGLIPIAWCVFNNMHAGVEATLVALVVNALDVKIGIAYVLFITFFVVKATNLRGSIVVHHYH